MRTRFHNARVFDGANARDHVSAIVERDRIVGLSYSDIESAPVEGWHIDLRGRTLTPGMTVGQWHPDYPNITLGSLGNVYIGLERPPSYLAVIAVKHP
jgi:hypothetical protein